MTESWEERVYAHYVSTGNLTNQPDPEQLFGPSRPYIEKIIREHFPTQKSARVLELGCGPAPFLYFLKRLGYFNLTGVDISKEQVALAHTVGLEKEVLQGDLVAFLDAEGFENYDVIILFDILEHFSISDQFEILDRVFIRLKFDGKCILHVPNAEGYCGTRVLYSDITHKSAFTRRSMEQLLHTVGFEGVRCFEDKPIPHGLFSCLRRTIWEIMTIGQVIAMGVETGNFKRNEYILSQNILAVTTKVSLKMSQEKKDDSEKKCI